MSASHCQLVLDALSDGEWHSTASLYRECGGMILHSRIADLRRRGHTIAHRHVGGQGADAHEYRLAEPSKQVGRCPHCYGEIVLTGEGRHPCSWCGGIVGQVTASQEAADIHRYGHVAAWR